MQFLRKYFFILLTFLVFSCTEEDENPISFVENTWIEFRGGEYIYLSNGNIHHAMPGDTEAYTLWKYTISGETLLVDGVDQCGGVIYGVGSYKFNQFPDEELDYFFQGNGAFHGQTFRFISNQSINPNQGCSPYLEYLPADTRVEDLRNEWFDNYNKR